jgi:hypothetical protein
MSAFLLTTSYHGRGIVSNSAIIYYIIALLWREHKLKKRGTTCAAIYDILYLFTPEDRENKFIWQ